MTECGPQLSPGLLRRLVRIQLLCDDLAGLVQENPGAEAIQSQIKADATAVTHALAEIIFSEPAC
jgi:hypothetical protein